MMRGHRIGHGRLTKIVFTLGPASGSPLTIERLIKGGMDCARLNFSHGSTDEHLEFMRKVREAANRLSEDISTSAIVIRFEEWTDLGNKFKQLPRQNRCGEYL